MRVNFIIVLLFQALLSEQPTYAHEPRKSVTREIIFTKEMAQKLTQSTNANFAPCHFRFSDSMFANLDDKTYFVEKYPLSRTCFDLKDKRVQAWAEYNSDSQKWGLVFINEKDRLERQDVTKLYEIKAMNSHGYVVTEDDIVGEESNRQRRMHFCLLHEPIALCGNASIMNLNESENKKLSYVLEILRNIEFIDVSAESLAVPASDTANP